MKKRNKVMYFLSDDVLKDKTPIGYYLNNRYYIYMTYVSYKDDEKIYKEKLFDNVDDLLNVLVKLCERRADKCQLIN